MFVLSVCFSVLVSCDLRVVFASFLACPFPPGAALGPLLCLGLAWLRGFALVGVGPCRYYSGVLMLWLARANPPHLPSCCCVWCHLTPTHQFQLNDVVMLEEAALISSGRKGRKAQRAVERTKPPIAVAGGRSRCLESRGRDGSSGLWPPRAVTGGRVCCWCSRKRPRTRACTTS